MGWPYAVDLRPGISEVAASARAPAPAPETWVTHPLDLDIGEVADGYHMIARSISLSAKYLRFEFAFAPRTCRGSGSLAEHVLRRRYPGQSGLHRSRG